MSESTLKDALLQAISDTIEEMTFQPVDEVLESIPKPEETDVWSLLPLESPYEGELVFAMPWSYAEGFTRIVYSLDDDAECTDEMIRDLVAELVNTVGGRFMANLVPPDQSFTLGLPKTGVGDYTPSEPAAFEIACMFGEYVVVSIVTGSDYDAIKK